MVYIKVHHNNSIVMYWKKMFQK